jgi:hypothetical protein
MQKLDLDDFDKKLPDQLNLAVVMQKQPSTHPWADFRYDALGTMRWVWSCVRQMKRNR